MPNSRLVHLAKTCTWRLIATGTTFILALIFFRDHPDVATKATWVAVTDVVLKMLFYYSHERIWYGIGRNLHARVKYMLKAISWRAIASITTFAIAMAYFHGHPETIQNATWVAGIEVFLKLILYYLHESAWDRYRPLVPQSA